MSDAKLQQNAVINLAPHPALHPAPVSHKSLSGAPERAKHQLLLADEEATENLGKTLARQTPPGGTWLLMGELGAGKTTWARGFVVGLGGCAEQVFSPTFSILHRYDTPRGKVYHLDLYRVGHSGVWNLGLEESITQEDYLIVEWAGSVGPWPTNWVGSLELAETSEARIASWYML